MAIRLIGLIYDKNIDSTHIEYYKQCPNVLIIYGENNLQIGTAIGPTTFDAGPTSFDENNDAALGGKQELRKFRSDIDNLEVQKNRNNEGIQAYIYPMLVYKGGTVRSYTTVVDSCIQFIN